MPKENKIKKILVVCADGGIVPNCIESPIKEAKTRYDNDLISLVESLAFTIDGCPNSQDEIILAYKKMITEHPAAKLLRIKEQNYNPEYESCDTYIGKSVDAKGNVIYPECKIIGINTEKMWQINEHDGHETLKRFMPICEDITINLWSCKEICN